MKKVLSLLLVLVLALGMSTVAFAAAKINKDPTVANNNGFAGKDQDFGDSAQPGATKSFLLTQGMFNVGTTTWASTGNAVPVLKADISASKLTVRTKISKGSNVIKKAELNYDGANKCAQVYVELVKPFKSNNTDGQEFDFTVYPVVDGRAWQDKGANFVGTLVNPETEIDANTDYVDLSYSAIATVDEYSKAVEYALGEGVSLFGRAIKGAKYWGVANTDATAAEDEMMAAKGIDMVYHVPVIGLNSVANYVVLNDADPTAYVYDKDLKYLGLAKEHLPYADTYYLAAKKLDVETEEEPEEEEEEVEEDVPVAPPVTGGTGTVAPTYDNPSTGK